MTLPCKSCGTPFSPSRDVNAPGPWSYNDEGDVNSSDGEEILPTDGGYYGQGEAVAQFIALHDPQSALANVAALRATLAIHSQPDHRCPGYLGYQEWPNPCDTMRALVSAFAGRPGYLEEWGLV